MRRGTGVILGLLAAGTLFGQSASRGRLELGQSQTAALRGGESHSYELPLRAGDFVFVVVDQRGIDVAVSLTGPDNASLAESDSPNYSVGPEPIWWVASTAGIYGLKIVSAEPSAPAADYAVALRELRPATDRDRRRVAAQTTALKAAKRSEAGSAEALREAAALYEESARLWRSVEEPAGEARALFALAYVRSRLGDTRGNLDAMQKTLALQPKIGDPGFEAASLAWIGIAYQDQGDRERAADYLTRASAIQTRIGDRLGEAVSLGALGQAQDFLGDYAAAMTSHRRAREILLSVGDRRAAAIEQNNIALVLDDLGDSEGALEGYGRALAVFREIGDKQNEAITLNNMAVTYQEREAWKEALAYHELALPLRRATGDKRGEAYTLTNLGRTQAKLKRFAEARANLASAGALQKEVGDRFAQATTDQAVGELELDAGSYESALQAFGRALALRREIRDRWGEAESLAATARALRRQGALETARENCEAALAVVESLRAGIAAPGQQSTFFSRVRSYYELEIDILMRLHARSPERRLDLSALEVSERARARGLLDLLAESRAKIRKGVDPSLLERDRSLRARLGTRLDAQRRLLGRSHTDAEATSMRKDVEDLVSDLQQVEGEIRTTSPRYAALTQPQPATGPDLQALLGPETLLLEYVLGEEQSFVWKITASGVSSFALAPRAEIEAAARAAYQPLAAAGGGVQERGGGADPVSRLSRLVLAPVGDLPARRIAVVADGALHFIPFVVLHDPAGGGTLLKRHEVVNLPSGSTLAILRKEAVPANSGRTVAVFADPVFEKSDPRLVGRLADRPSSSPSDSGGEDLTLSRSVRDVGLSGLDGITRLPFTRREAQAILDLVPAPDRWQALDFDATREAVTNRDLTRFRYIHLATHGFVDTVHPELSGLVLTLLDPQGRDVPGFLPASDVFNLQLPADLVVLSACRTALGKDVRGEGLVGITRAFMYAGAPRVIASLWRVDDAATAELMKSLYEGMLGPARLRPAAALREAQLAVAKQKRWSDPHFWAGFVLQGEWN
jgi:CHAT domain-containing protein/tetratricopeptide (TPR) repeat protein